MTEKEFYDEAIKEMQYLCKAVIIECEEFADNHNYDKEWVLVRFQEQFSKVKQMYLEGKL